MSNNRLIPFTAGLQMYVVLTGLLCRLSVVFVNEDRIWGNCFSAMRYISHAINQWCDKGDRTFVNKVYYKQCLKLFNKTGSQLLIVVRRYVSKIS